jgi:endonuclease/exonuclease/phosphatase family metal-dependent hydrolase
VTAELWVLHWNIHSWRDAAGAPNLRAVAALVQQTSPDVVSLTEVNEPWGAPADLAALAAECGYGWLFVPSIAYGTSPRRRGYGNALLVRSGVTNVQQVDVFAPPGRYDGSEESETRSVLLARVSGGVWVGSTHFPASSRASRRTAAAALLDLVSSLSTPWIVCGDYNAAPSALFAGHPGVRVHPDSGVPTFPAHRPRTRIDYFLASPDVSVSASVLSAGGSDHLPILAVCALLGVCSVSAARTGPGGRRRPAHGRCAQEAGVPPS